MAGKVITQRLCYAPLLVVLVCLICPLKSYSWSCSRNKGLISNGILKNLGCIRKDGISSRSKRRLSMSTSYALSSDNMKQLESSPQFPRTWVPVASTFELDVDRPTPVSFLGQNYVLYCNNDNVWSVLDDACSHRLAPLSEGRIDRSLDVLECAYHGWAFDSQGSCTRIPQMDTSEKSCRIRCSTEACVKAYPTKVEKGIVFMWPWSESLPSTASEEWTQPEFMMKDTGENATTYTRDFPYGWDMLVENLIDPAHIPWAHHGLQGKRTDALPINMTSASSYGPHGFTFTFEDRTMGMLRKGHADFKAPYVINYLGNYDATPTPFKLSVICIPTRPGWSRAIIFSREASIQSENIKEKDKEIKPQKAKLSSQLFRKVFSILPTWLLHQLSHKFLDSDLAFLHYQQYELEKRSESNSNNLPYFIPARCDLCVATFRKWIRQYAHLPRPLPPPISQTDRLSLFDHYGQHTSHCIHCQKGLETLSRWRRNAKVSAALSLLLCRFFWARLMLICSIGVSQLIKQQQKTFFTGEFKHYKNH